MSENNEKNIFESIDNIYEDNVKKHIGKMGIILSLLGGISAGLISINLIIPASIAMGLCNIGIFAGSLAYERLQNNLAEVKN